MYEMINNNATTSITEAIKVIDCLEEAMWNKSLDSNMDYKERSAINGFLMNLKSVLKGMEDGDSPFLLSVYTDALTREMANPHFKETTEKFATILTNEEQQKAMMLGNILESIDSFRSIDECLVREVEFGERSDIQILNLSRIIVMIWYCCAQRDCVNLSIIYTNDLLEVFSTVSCRDAHLKLNNSLCFCHSGICPDIFYVC